MHENFETFMVTFCHTNQFTAIPSNKSYIELNKQSIFAHVSIK